MVGAGSHRRGRSERDYRGVGGLVPVGCRRPVPGHPLAEPGGRWLGAARVLGEEQLQES